jgi:Xaa-Pro aminopeptidase
MENRLERARAQLAASKLDTLLISDIRNIQYLLGITGHADLDVVAVLTVQNLRVVTDSRYWEYVERAGFKDNLVRVKPGATRLDAVAEAIHEVEGTQVGFEARHLTVAMLRELNKVARKNKFKLKPTLGWIEKIRNVKDASELNLIKHAVKIADDAFGHFCTIVKPGLTEKEAAWILESFIRTHGAEALAFDPIVASGPNAALPHAVPSDREIKVGEPLTLDLGATYQGYRSDLTRTICLGKPTEKFTEIYNIVLKAQKTAEKRIRAGIRGKKADSYARKVIANSGYGANFGHGTGHGVGLAIHEGPGAGVLSRDLLEEGMTLTIEPGIYLPGWGGVRIEDLVVIKKDGLEILSQSTKDPIVSV